MKIKFLGASGTVTGSSYVLTGDGGDSLLIDLGMFQGTDEIEKLNFEPYEYECNKLTGAILTHAHLDHCGRLPILYINGYRGKIKMTPATRDLVELSLLDAAKVAKNNGGKILYTGQQAATTIDNFETVEYHTPFQIGEFTITFRDAGHILGSSTAEIVDEKAIGEIKKIVFSGDLGNYPEDLEMSTEFIDSSDAVVMESTYGDRLHPKSDPDKQLQEEINAIETSHGTLLIPAFSLDRTQEILHMIKHLKSSGKVLESTPVFLDSPMGEKATLDYLKYKQLFNSHIQSDFEFGDPFDFPNLVMIKDWHQSQGLQQKSGPQVIIAGSGMMSGGRILGHAAHFLPMSTTRLFIVGYQGEDTLGREILEGNKKIIIDNNEIEVKATVSETQALSSHADQSQLLKWLSHIKGVKKLFITHGEDPVRKYFEEKIKKDLGLTDITLPEINQEVSF